jgi:hypothetical protein
MPSNGGPCVAVPYGEGGGRAGRQGGAGTKVPVPRCPAENRMETRMGRYMLLWLLGVPIPILLLIWAFGGLN